MKRQSKSWTCGIASIANALEVVGIKRSQREVARHCHVSPEHGTDETEIKRGLLACGVHVDEWWDSTQPASMQWLQAHILHCGPAILCVDNDDHWVTVVGICDQTTFIVFDPSRNMGVEVHAWDTLATRWVNETGAYYGIGIST